MSDCGDLQAVVRGFTNGFCANYKPPTTCSDPLTCMQEEDDHQFGFSSTYPGHDLYETDRVLDELEQLYKPFYPTLINPLSPDQTMVSSSGGEKEAERVQGINQPFTGSPFVSESTTGHLHEVQNKRRKNRQKRLVTQVKTEDLASDVWAWRKYGQKPIKGSPFPRSYYRCSSSKGCPARKQVERSLSDPETFLVTYTAEHCHGQPTRKNSLAGTTRNRFISSPKSSAAAEPTTPTAKHSPCSPPPATAEDGLLSPQGVVQRERIEQEEDERKMVAMYDVLLNDDFLVGFDDLAFNGDFYRAMSDDLSRLIDERD